MLTHYLLHIYIYTKYCTFSTWVDMVNRIYSIIWMCLSLTKNKQAKHVIHYEDVANQGCREWV